MTWRGLVQSMLPEAVRTRCRVPQFAVEILVALSLAFLVWLYIRTRDHESLDHVPVPVQITLAPGQAEQYDLEVTGSRHVLVSFVGPPSGIRELRGMLQRGEVRVDVSLSVPEDRRGESKYRDTVRIDAADVPVPPGVTALVAASGNRIPVTLHRLVERHLLVHLNSTAEEGLGEVALEPASVLVRGPEDILERTPCILTRPYHLPVAVRNGARDKPFTVQLPLVREIEGRPVRPMPGVVTVRLASHARPRVYELENVPVTFLCPPRFPYRPQFTSLHPGTLDLRVKAPALMRPPHVVAYIDLTEGDYKAGLNAQPLRLQLPRGCQLAQEPPGSLRFELVPITIDYSRFDLRVVPEP
jgi:hypothetical protein